MKQYGMPYKGSKNKIAERLFAQLPSAECFVDLFGGGGAMSDCAARSGKYKRVIYNELNPVVYKGFVMALNGAFKSESRWISREEFQHLRDIDPYAAICFSFGNNLRNYAYSPENERVKQHLHNVFFAETPNSARLQFKKLLNEIKKLYAGTEVSIYEKLCSLQSLESLERLQRLQNLENIRNIRCYNLSYEQVDIPKNSVVYCDIPYKNTKGYQGKFDYDKFYAWALNSENSIFISEYFMPESFTEIYRLDKTCSLGNSNNKPTVERLFVNRAL